MGKVGKVFLTGALIAGGVLLAGVTGGGSLVALAHGFGMAATGLGLGIVSRQLFGPQAMANRVSEVRQTIANPLAALPVVYGTAKVGIKLVDIRPGTGFNTRKLYIVGAVCHGSHNGLPGGGGGGSDPGGISAIKRIWFDEKLAFDASGTLQSTFKKGATPYAAVTKYLGTMKQAADSTMTTAFPSQWTSLHQGRGVAYLVFTLTLDPDIYQGIPNITVEVDGAKCLDPRESDVTYTFSHNPALQALDYLLAPIYGMDTGRRLALDSSAVASSGVSSFSAANTVDGNPDTQAFHTDSAVPGAYVQFDMGRAVELDRVDVYVTREGVPAQQFEVQYADSSGGSYTTVPMDATGTFLLTGEGRNTFRWPSNLTGSHQFWRLRLANTPGAGPYINGVDWFETEIDYASFADEANTCDQTVNEPPAESAFKTATASTASNPLRLSIASHGWSTSDLVHVSLAPGFTASGLTDASGPIEGRTYTMTNVSSGIISLNGINASGSYVANSLRVGKLVSVAQYQSNGVLDTAQEPQDNLRQILSSFRGRIIWQAGKFRCHSRKTTTTSLQLTDEDVRSIRWITPGTREKYNQARVNFLNADRDWQPDERAWPPAGVVNDFVIEDNGFPSLIDMDLPLVNSPYQADRLGQITVRESRDGITVELLTGARGMLAQVGDVVGLTLTTPGWAAKTFAVERVAFLPDEDLPSLTLVEYEPNAYILSDTVLHPSAPNTSLPDATAKPDAPTGLTLSATDADMAVQPNGEVIPRIRVTWDAIAWAFARYVEVQAYRTIDALADTWGQPPATDTEFFVSPVNVGEEWTVQIRTVTTLGIASDWVTATVTPTLVTRSPAVGVVDFFDDYPGTRWISTGSGTKAIVTGGDAKYGGGVLRLTENCTGTWGTKIPLDRGVLYSQRFRARMIRDNNSADAYLSVGYVCYNADKNAIDENSGGVGGPAIRANAASQFRIPLTGEWVEYAGYARGWNGGWHLPSASELTNSGLGNYTAANVGDGNPSTKAFDTDSATSGAFLRLDFGVSGSELIRARLYLDASGGTAQFKIQHSPDASAWTDVTFRGGGTTWTPNLLGWNEIDWTSPGSAKRYWRLLLNNTPGAGPDVYEFAVMQRGAHNYASYLGVGYPDRNAPMPFPPGTAYIAPVFDWVGDGSSVDGILEIDMLELPPAAGTTALL